MILGSDIHPEKKIYYIGALVLGVLKKSRSNRLACFELYTKVREKYGLSINAFTLALDWLYLLGVIKHISGEVEKCSRKKVERR